jgi:hypothetical protein
VCQLVLSRDAPGGAAVLIGNLVDNPSTAPTNALERIAALIANRLSKGQVTYRLYQYEREGLPSLAPTVYAIRWPAYWLDTDLGARRARHRPVLVAAKPLVSREPYTPIALAGLPVIDATTPAGVVGEHRAAAAGRA